MANKIAVKVSGSIVSSLFFEHVNSPGDQEGFLLGEFVKRVTRIISDSHMSAEKEEISMHIYTIVPCDEQSFSFYDVCGRLQEEKLNYYLKDRRKEVIGWYRFRRNTPLEISLREHAVHENLCQLFGRGYDKSFLFGIFTSCDTHETSTYTFDHIILRSTRLGFERSSLNIINLGTTSHAEYLVHPHDATNICSGDFSEVVNKINVDNVASVSHVLEMHKCLRLKLEAVKEEVISSEVMIGSVCLEIAQLEAKIQAIKDEQKQLEEEEEEEEEEEDDYLELNQESTEQYDTCIEEPEQDEHEQLLIVALQNCPKKSQSDPQRKEQMSVEENFTVSVQDSLNMEEQDKVVCPNPEGGSSPMKDAT